MNGANPQDKTGDAVAQAEANSRTGARRMVAGAMLGNMVSANTVLTFTFGVFIGPFHTSFGWSRAEIALSMSCFTIVAFLGSALIGRFADVSNPQRLAVASILAFGIGLILLPQLVRSVQSLWAAYFFLAILGLGTSPAVLNRPFMSAFSRHRGIAIALALTGTGIGGFVLPQFAAALVDRGDWQYAFNGLGWLVLITAPAVWFLLRRSAIATQSLTPKSVAADPGLEWREAYRSRAFWTLSVIALSGGLGMSGPAAHLIPLLGDQGIGSQSAARLASVIGIASMVGRLLTGVALDRFNTPLSGAPFLLAGAFGLFLLSRFDPGSAAFAIALLGSVIGAEIAILAYYSSRYFGLRAHAAIFGWAYGLVAIGSAFGPVLVGALRDRLGDYSLAFALSAVALGIAGTFCLLLGPYRFAADLSNGTEGILEDCPASRQ